MNGRRGGSGFTRVLWHFASFKLQSVDTSTTDTKQAPLLLAFSFGRRRGMVQGSKKGSRDGLAQRWKRANSLSLALFLVFVSSYGKKKGVAACERVPRDSLRIFLPALALPRGHFAMETALDEPRLLQCEFPTARFECAPSLAHRSEPRRFHPPRNFTKVESR